MDFDTNQSMNPDLDDVLQEDSDAYNPDPVAVRLTGAARVHPLPARIAHSRNLNVTDSADPVNLEIIASDDPRRQYLVVSVQTNPVFVGHDKQQVADGLAGILPVGQLLHLPTEAPVYVRSTAAGGSVVSYWSGQWAD